MAPEESAAFKWPTIDLIYDDGEPLESNWHRIEMNLLIDVVWQAMVKRGRADFFAGGNMFIYFSSEQAEFVATHPPARYRHFTGPDFFFVGGVEPAHTRNAWVVWEEEGRYPDVIIELLSPSTAMIDKTTKKERYERTFRTPEYFWYDPSGDELMGWRLAGRRYEEIKPDGDGRLWSEELELWLGRWHGVWLGEEGVWLRFYDSEGRLAPTPAEAERERAEAERQRAEAAEAEVASLKARLAELEKHGSAARPIS